MNKLFQELSIPHRANYNMVRQLRVDPTASTQHFPIPKSERDPDVIKFLDDHGLNIVFSELFYTAPQTWRTIHIDGETIGIDLFKFNWVYGADGSTMKWYEVQPDYTPALRTTKAGTYAYVFNKDKCNLLYETEIKHPCIVQGGIPHTVFNSTDEGRWCVSYSIGDNETGEFATWDKLVAELGQYFIPQ
jgi:hypothetical protein